MNERDDVDRPEEPFDEKPEPYDLEEEREEGPPPGRRPLDADFLLDKVMPRDVDWRNTVRRHPLASVGVAVGLGFLIGRSKGAAIIAGVSSAVTNAVMHQLSDVLEGEVFEF